MKMNLSFTIRPVLPEDAAGLASLRRMPGIMENTMGLPSCRDIESAEFIEELGPNDHHFVAVDADGTLIGSAGLVVYSNPRTRHVGCLGICIHTDYQGQGVGTALMHVLLDLADNWLMLERVELDVYADNLKAQNLYEKMGFVKEGLKRRAAIRDGAYVDEFIMGRLRPVKAAVRT